MPRVARGLADGLVYRIINRGNGRQEVFHIEQDYLAFVVLLKEALPWFPVRLYAYLAGDVQELYCSGRFPSAHSRSLH